MSSISPLVPPHVAKSTFALFWGLGNPQSPFEINPNYQDGEKQHDEKNNNKKQKKKSIGNSKNNQSVDDDENDGDGDTSHQNQHRDDENLFLGTAFAIAPCVALTAGHHLRLRLDDCGKLNLRELGTHNNNIHNSGNQKEKKTQNNQKISARVSYIQKDNSVDILVMWLDRPVEHFLPLRALHPLVGQRIMLVSAAISVPHSDIVVSTGVVSRSPTTNPDAASVLCRAQGLVSARGYSGSLVLEYVSNGNAKNNNDAHGKNGDDDEGEMVKENDGEATSKSANKKKSVSKSRAQAEITNKHEYVYTPLPKQRVLGMHVSVYQDKSTKDNIEIEFVSAYRILRMMAIYNVDLYSTYARGKAPKQQYQLPKQDCVAGQINEKIANENREPKRRQREGNE